MRETLFYETLDDGRVRCTLCPHNCVIKAGCVGICRQRANVAGTLESRIYGRVTSTALDPIEKKPLYHFRPGEIILSLGTKGCNFRCAHCQNWQISQEDAETFPLSPEEAIELAKEHDSFGISYTYNEPLIWYEYVFDTAQLARQAGLKNVLVTNGFIEEAPFRALLPYIDALNIDIKSISESFYNTICKGFLKPVLRNAIIANETAHVEITNLIIPTQNDSHDDLTGLAVWIRDNLGPETPTHLSAYFPRYQAHAPATPAETLVRAHEIFKQCLSHVYLGNIMVKDASDTHCPQCGEAVIQRRGYSTRITALDGSNCAKCGRKLNIVR